MFTEIRNDSRSISSVHIYFVHTPHHDRATSLASEKHHFVNDVRRPPYARLGAIHAHSPAYAPRKPRDGGLAIRSDFILAPLSRANRPTRWGLHQRRRAFQLKAGGRDREGRTGSKSCTYQILKLDAGGAGVRTEADVWVRFRNRSLVWTHIRSSSTPL